MDWLDFAFFALPYPLIRLISHQHHHPAFLYHGFTPFNEIHRVCGNGMFEERGALGKLVPRRDRVDLGGLLKVVDKDGR